MHLGDENLSFFGDGEILCRDRNFSIDCHPSALKVCRFNEKTIFNKVINSDEVRSP